MQGALYNLFIHKTVVWKQYHTCNCAVLLNILYSTLACVRLFHAIFAYYLLYFGTVDFSFMHFLKGHSFFTIPISSPQKTPTDRSICTPLLFLCFSRAYWSLDPAVLHTRPSGCCNYQPPSPCTHTYTTAVPSHNFLHVPHPPTSSQLTSVLWLLP